VGGGFVYLNDGRERLHALVMTVLKKRFI